MNCALLFCLFPLMGKTEEGSVLFFASLKRHKTQAENFRTSALYFLIFRAECSLVISLFPKEFYPAGGVALSRRFWTVRSSLEQQNYDRVASFPLYVILCSELFDFGKAVCHDTRPSARHSHQPPWKLRPLARVKAIVYLCQQREQKTVQVRPQLL